MRADHATKQPQRLRKRARVNHAGGRQAFDSAPVGLALVGPEGRFLQVNPRLCRLLGYAEKQLLASTLGAVTDPHDLKTLAVRSSASWPAKWTSSDWNNASGAPTDIQHGARSTQRSQLVTESGRSPASSRSTRGPSTGSRGCRAPVVRGHPCADGSFDGRRGASQDSPEPLRDRNLGARGDLDRGRSPQSLASSGHLAAAGLGAHRRETMTGTTCLPGIGLPGHVWTAGSPSG